MVEIILSGKYQTSKFHTKCNIDFYKQINIKQIEPKDNLIGISQQLDFSPVGHRPKQLWKNVKYHKMTSNLLANILKNYKQNIKKRLENELENIFIFDFNEI